MENVPWIQGRLGPMYRPGAPHMGSGLRGVPMYDRATYRGDLLNIEIKISTSLDVWAYGSTIEMWHADENGEYDEVGFRYRAIWDTAGRHAKINIDTALPGITIWQGRPIYRHINLLVTPRPNTPGRLQIADWRGEILLQLPGATPPERVVEPRAVCKLNGPYTHGMRPYTWYQLSKTICLEAVR
jgi:hypothetical protein